MWRDRHLVASIAGHESCWLCRVALRSTPTSIHNNMSVGQTAISIRIVIRLESGRRQRGCATTTQYLVSNNIQRSHSHIHIHTFASTSTAHIHTLTSFQDEQDRGRKQASASNRSVRQTCTIDIAQHPYRTSTSKTQHRICNMQHPASNHATGNRQHSAFDLRDPSSTSNIHHPTSNGHISHLDTCHVDIVLHRARHGRTPRA